MPLLLFHPRCRTCCTELLYLYRQSLCEYSTIFLVRNSQSFSAVTLSCVKTAERERKFDTRTKTNNLTFESSFIIMYRQNNQTPRQEFKTKKDGSNPKNQFFFFFEDQNNSVQARRYEFLSKSN